MKDVSLDFLKYKNFSIIFNYTDNLVSGVFENTNISLVDYDDGWIVFENKSGTLNFNIENIYCELIDMEDCIKDNNKKLYYLKNKREIYIELWIYNETI